VTDTELKTLMTKAGIVPTGRHVDAVTLVCCEVSAKLLIAVEYYVKGGQSPGVGQRALADFTETVNHSGCG